MLNCVVSRHARCAVPQLLTLAVIASLSTPLPASATTPTAFPTFAPPLCVGDCNGDGRVTVNEIIGMVNVGLAYLQPSACPNGIASGVDVDISLIMRAVNNALIGCRVPQTPTPTLTATPSPTNTPTPSPFLCANAHTAPRIVNHVGSCEAVGCFDVVAPSTCCWFAAGGLEITSGGTGCGNGTVCYRAHLFLCDSHPGCIDENVAGRRFEICLEVPTPVAIPTPVSIPPEPVITFFGVTRADDTLVAATTTLQGVPVFERTSYDFSLVVEGRPGGSGTAIGTGTYNWSPTDPTLLPSLLIEASRPLGNGSLAVCDETAPDFGGIPPINPPNFSATQPVANAINDFACRFQDGRGAPSGRDKNHACTVLSDGL